MPPKLLRRSLLVWAGLCAPQGVWAATLDVCPTGCTYAEIAAAAAAASGGDTIEVGPGTYTAPVTLDANVDVVGLGGSAATVLSAPGGADMLLIHMGANASVTGLTLGRTGLDGRCLRVDQGAHATASDLRFEDCVHTGDGGAVLVDGGAELVLDSAWFSGGSAARGGHMAVLATAAVTGATFAGGTAGKGGALYVGAGGDAILLSASFVGNQADEGGAVHSVGANLDMGNAAFSGNSSTSYGGAVFSTSTLKIDLAVVDDNEADLGGAIAIAGTNAVLRRIRFCGNRATSHGGAVHIDAADEPFVAVYNSVFIENNAALQGGALWADRALVDAVNNDFLGNTAAIGGAVASGSPALDFRNNIVAGSSIAGVGNAGTATVDYTLWHSNDGGKLVGGVETNAVNGNPQLADVTYDGICTNDDITPLPSSPAIDAGDPAAQYRDPDGSRNDIGATGGMLAPAGCADADADGTCDAVDLCIGYDDGADADGDCVPDACDPNPTEPDAGGSWYPDVDGDGYGDASATPIPSCTPVAGAVLDNTDCDDNDPTQRGLQDWYADADGDGYGDATAVVSACALPSGAVDNPDDCDDGTAERNPGATEVCDPLDVDEDCDGLADDADPSATGQPLWYPDADGDGFGADSAPGTASCDPPAGSVADATDCDDTLASVYPGADEVWYDGIDQGCDGGSDGDRDGDGADALQASGDDCDDDDATVFPGAPEVIGDGVDQDCTGDDLEQWYGSAGGCACSSTGSLAPAGWVLVLLSVGFRRRP